MTTMTPAPRLVLYRTPFARRNQRHRWRLVAGNGRKLASSGEGYSDAAAAKEMATRILSGEFADTVATGNP